MNFFAVDVLRRTARVLSVRLKWAVDGGGSSHVVGNPEMPKLEFFPTGESAPPVGKNARSSKMAGFGTDLASSDQ